MKSEKPSSFDEGFSNSSLTMSYFHTGTRTIIGAGLFHGPVRDGKGWVQAAMAAKRNGLLQRFHVKANLEEVGFVLLGFDCS